jgi:hypothetical protein
MRCDECKYWERISDEGDKIQYGNCERITEEIDAYVDSRGDERSAFADTIADFFCAAFEGKDDE